MKFVTAAAFGLILLSSAALPARRRAPGCRRTAAPRSASAIAAARLCGTVVWLNKPIDRATGKPKTDKHNPDPAKRARPLIGLQVAQRLARRAARTNGRARSTMPTTATPTRRASRCRATSTAKVQGCVLMVLCKGHTWTRGELTARRLAVAPLARDEVTITPPAPAGRTAPPAPWDPSCRCPGAARVRAPCRAGPRGAPSWSPASA